MGEALQCMGKWLNKKNDEDMCGFEERVNCGVDRASWGWATGPSLTRSASVEFYIEFMRFQCLVSALTNHLSTPPLIQHNTIQTYNPIPLPHFPAIYYLLHFQDYIGWAAFRAARRTTSSAASGRPRRIRSSLLTSPNTAPATGASFPSMLVS